MLAHTDITLNADFIAQVVALVAAVGAILGTLRTQGKQRANEAEAIHTLVNSKHTEALNEIESLKGEVTQLKEAANAGAVTGVPSNPPGPQTP